MAVLGAYRGITTSASADLILVAGEMAVIAALAITILVKIGPARYSAAVLSPASSPNQRLTDITDAMIYGFTAFAGFEAAAALGEEARNSRRSVPASIVGIVVVTGIFYLLVVCAERLHADEPAALHSLRLAFIGAVIASLLRARRPAEFQALGRRAAPDESS